MQEKIIAKSDAQKKDRVVTKISIRDADGIVRGVVRPFSFLRPLFIAFSVSSEW